MHWMREAFGWSCVAILAVAWFTPRASADLLHPNAARSYPDIAADVNGRVDYTYNASSHTGVFRVRNTPFLMATGPNPENELTILPNGDNGIRQQILNLTVDHTGQIVNNPNNLYELWGSVTTNGLTFSGLLLKGVPTAFGSTLGVASSVKIPIFDADLRVTGGALAPYFGPDAYVDITPLLDTTFTGNFDADFFANKAASNTRAYHAPVPIPVPEPTTTLVLLMAGGSGLLYRHLKRPGTLAGGRLS